MDPALLEYLIRRMNLTKRDNLIPGGRIHNFRHFMDFPENVFEKKNDRRKPFVHPLLVEERITESDVRARFVANGLFAIYEHPEGRREFVGEPVPPSTPEANLSA